MGIYIVRGRSGLTAQDEDILTAEKWNELVNKVETNSNLLSTGALTRTNATLENGWINYDTNTRYPVSYTKDNFGNVTIRGLIKSGTNLSCVFTLPQGYRPLKRYLYTTQNGNGIGRIDILANGCVYGYITNSSRSALDGISFKAEQ
ncbi:MAG: hypothetical protein V3575_00245 [Candidatus Absconditabacteria bacterium]